MSAHAEKIQDELEPSSGGKRSGNHKLIVAVFVTAAITLAGAWVVMTYIYPRAFNPVELSAMEQLVLDGKLDRLGVRRASQRPSRTVTLQAEPYREDGFSREVSFTEKELNGLLANNTNLAQRLAIDLSDNLASAKLLIPMEEGFPVVGGRTIRLDAGLELGFANNRPVVALRGVSIMGVSLPNAWLGNLKNVDLVREFGGDPGSWNAFAEGIEAIELQEGELKIRLKE